MDYFGEPWPSDVCDHGRQVKTPAGHTCLLCDEWIREGDQGVYYATGDPVHRECSLRAVVGGIEHLTAGPHQAGTCYEGSELTYRESARQALLWVQLHGIPRAEGEHG